MNFFNLRKNVWHPFNMLSRLQCIQMWVEMENWCATSVLDPRSLGQVLFEGQYLCWKNTESFWSLPETERIGGAGERHQSCHYEHLRLSGVKANWWAKICCPISFQGVTISGDEENGVFCLAVLNTKAFNSNSNHAGGICCWGNSVCWELEGGHQFISHIVFLQETQHNWGQFSNMNCIIS